MLSRILSRTFSLSSDSYSTIGIFFVGSIAFDPRSSSPEPDGDVLPFSGSGGTVGGGFFPAAGSAGGTGGFVSVDVSAGLLSAALLSAGLLSAGLLSAGLLSADLLPAVFASADLESAPFAASPVGLSVTF